MTKHLLVAFWISGCCMVLTALSAQAHNGAVAIAVPLEGIVIDGDLSDWPEGMRVYPIACPITRMPENEEDFKGSFRIGYNEDESAIFLAVEMLDESVVARTKIERRINDDACQLFLDSSHKEGEHPTRVFLISGNSSEASGNDVNLEDYQAEVQRTEYGHQFEWRVDLGLESGFHPGMSLGVNILLHDKDAEDPVSIMSWGNTGGWASGGLGDVVLIEAEGELGELTGRLIWENGKGVARGRMRIVSSELWMTVGADQSGVFSVEIPAGNYRVSSVIESVEEIDAVVGKGEIHQVGEQVVPAPKGKTINIVPDKKTESQGTRKAAGSGRWQGRWQMLDVGDGLPDPTVTDILQDKEGFLWFSTMGGGVSRYDGNEFAHYTEADGLGANGVKCMLEDREGNLWFGVTHGIGFGIPETGYLTRFDGRYMTRFPLESDLSGNRINALEEDQEGNLWIGLNGGLIRYDGDEFVHFSEADGLVSDRVFDVAVGNRGELWVGTQGGLIRYDGESFDNFTPEDGPFYRVLEIEKSREGELWWGSLTGCVSRNVIQQFSTKSIEVESTDAEVYAIREDGQGNMWIGMNGGGVMLYDGSEWDTFTSMDGAEGDRVMAIYEDRGRDVWIGTGTWVGDSSIAGMGVRRFVGEEWTTYTTADGLPSNGVMSVLEDRKGNIWVGTWEGACWYDGREFRKLDDLIGNVFAIMEDSRGNIWFGTIDRGVYTFDGERVVHFQQEGYLDDSNIIAFLEDREGNIWMGGRGGGARKYDGEKLTVYTVADGLENNTASAFWEDQKGDIWIGAGRWASRYDGEKFISISTADGLIEGDINAFLEDRKGNIWIGTSGGISKYDGEKFTSFTVADGLAHSHVQDIIEDEQGHLWFATYGGGISRYDGRIFQTLLKQDGLAHNGTQEILQDSRGDFWIPNEGGLTRFRPRPTPPPVRLTRILADGEYEPTEEISFPASQDYLAFEFVGSSFKTRSNQMAYAYILEGYDTDWGQTRERRAVYRDLPVGDYVFKVKAVDRDLTYSTEPAVVRVVVHLPYVRISLIGGLAIAMVGFVVALGYGIGKRRDQRQAERALMQELEDELQTAHDLQMGLMPTSSPQIAGFDIAGRCLTANHVGGDYFQYFQEDDRFLVCLADVTGHAMEAAIPALVFDGILRTEMHEFQTPGQLFTRLNQTLCKTLETRTFVCFCAVEIDRESGILQLANGACPYPYHFRAATGEVAELQVEAYPLGVRSNTVYPVVEFQLTVDDWIIFCSDGIVEAENEDGDLFGFERTGEIVRNGCADGLSAEGLIERLIGAVKEFAGDVPQGDDMTCVAVRRDGTS